MALVIDTRFLLAHTLPPSEDDRRILKEFTSKLAGEELIIPSIVPIEFIKIAGSVIGKDNAKVRLKLWIKGGVKIFPIDGETAFLAGEIALQHRNIPIADVIIGAVAIQLNAEIVTDDLHFTMLGVKTLWYK